MTKGHRPSRTTRPSAATTRVHTSARPNQGAKTTARGSVGSKVPMVCHRTIIENTRESATPGSKSYPYRRRRVTVGSGHVPFPPSSLAIPQLRTVAPTMTREFERRTFYNGNLPHSSREIPAIHLQVALSVATETSSPVLYHRALMLTHQACPQALGGRMGAWARGAAVAVRRPTTYPFIKAACRYINYGPAFVSPRPPSPLLRSFRHDLPSRTCARTHPPPHKHDDHSESQTLLLCF